MNKSKSTAKLSYYIKRYFSIMPASLKKIVDSYTKSELSIENIAMGIRCYIYILAIIISKELWHDAQNTGIRAITGWWQRNAIVANIKGYVSQTTGQAYQ
jgi:poly(A) polymerase Pap1